MLHKTVGNWRYVRPVLSNVDYKTVQGICCVQLRKRPFEDTECGNVEAFKKYLTDTLMRVSRQGVHESQ